MKSKWRDSKVVTALWRQSCCHCKAKEK